MIERNIRLHPKAGSAQGLGLAPADRTGCVPILPRKHREDC